MHKISLKDWVLILTILPTTLISFGLASYFSYSRSTELNSFLEQRAKSIIEPIAIASKDALIEKNRAKLRRLINFTHRNQSNIVKSIIIFTEDNQVFVTSAYNGDTNLMRLKAGVELPSHTSVEVLNDYTIFRTPIIDEAHLHQDSDNSSNYSTKQYSFYDTDPASTTIGYIAMQVDKSHLKFQQQS
jgi:two-component system sensor histidine kinase BarA